MIVCKDSLEFLKSLDDYSNDILYSDPPYALGSEVIIRADGKVDYKKASDFMNKWEMPTGDYWEKWFIEAYRTLKHGGYCIMFGMDRQLLLFKYYANLAGFQEQQSLYWYFISNFPKATNLSLSIDKNAGLQGQVGIGGFNMAGKGEQENRKAKLYTRTEADNTEKYEVKSDLAKKYDGYKYSISPLKQTNETIMVFQKPTKTGSPLHDTLAYENGDTTITVSALNIDGNRVATKEDLNYGNQPRTNNSFKLSQGNEERPIYDGNGRYPSQTFIDSAVAEVLDKQSDSYSMLEEYEGGCSKILHKCDYEQEDYDLYHYEPKVSSGERNAGCDGMEETETLTGLDVRGRTLEREDGTKTLVDRFVKKPQVNSHPTLKPIALNERILKLFKTPNEQKICYAFSGSGSEIIGGIKAGFDTWIACEINQEYVDIANARIKYWEETMTTQISIFDLLGKL